MSKADKLFELQIYMIREENELGDLLDSFPPPFAWCDLSYEYYDFSLQIFGVPDTYKLCGKDAEKLKKYGFHRVWMHKVNNKNDYTNQSQSTRTKEGERFYNL